MVVPIVIGLDFCSIIFTSVGIIAVPILTSGTTAVLWCFTHGMMVQKLDSERVLGYVSPKNLIDALLLGQSVKFDAMMNWSDSLASIEANESSRNSQAVVAFMQVSSYQVIRD